VNNAFDRERAAASGIRWLVIMGNCDGKQVHKEIKEVSNVRWNPISMTMMSFDSPVGEFSLPPGV
jgi:Icc-related predicted phosphoesterase